jgi:hypothetical protein
VDASARACVGHLRLTSGRLLDADTLGLSPQGQAQYADQRLQRRRASRGAVGPCRPGQIM